MPIAFNQLGQLAATEAFGQLSEFFLRHVKPAVLYIRRNSMHTMACISTHDHILPPNTRIPELLHSTQIQLFTLDAFIWSLGCRHGCPTFLPGFQPLIADYAV
jgi:hypothetical protein